MFLRHMKRLPENAALENTFEYVDETTGEITSSAVIYTTECPLLIPSRPVQIRVEFEGSPIPAAVYGAVLARSRAIAYEYGKPTRLYTRCAPNDTSFLTELIDLGFTDDDGLLRMQLPRGYGYSYTMPAGYTVVRDALLDPTEQQLFLERYNRLYGAAHDTDWLSEYVSRDRFQRILALDPSGIAGELTLWLDGDSGVIGYVQTTRQCRRHGIASALISMACDTVFRYGVKYAQVNIQARTPHMLKLLTDLGFRETRVLTKYPGIDFDPEEDYPI